MTEQEWLSCLTRPAEMIRLAAGQVVGRKLRLLGFASCRLVLEHIFFDRAVEILGILERDADGIADESELLSTDAVNELYLLLHEATISANGSPFEAALYALHAAVHNVPAESIAMTRSWVEECVSRAATRPMKKADVAMGRRRMCDLVREVIGNPFRPWKGVPEFLGGGVVQPDGQTVHLTDTVRQLAHGLHVDQAFDRLPILADALEESGITDAALLAHCRNETHHVRGCWALDVALGRV